MRSSIHPMAEGEISQAADFYFQNDPPLAARFLVELENAIDLLSRYPLAGQLVDDRHRRKVVNDFPYSVFYRVSGGEIRIIAVAHQSRESEYWAGRT